MDLANNMISRDSLLSFVVQAGFTKLNVTHSISFHLCNNRARKFAENAKKVLEGNISVFCVDGTMSTKERDRTLKMSRKSPNQLLQSIVFC